MHRILDLQHVKDNITNIIGLLAFVILSTFIVNSFIKTSYMASAIISPAESDNSLSSVLGGGIGGSLVGNLLNSDSTSVQVALATLESTNFLNEFVIENNLLSELEVKNTAWDIHKEMLKRVSADKISGSQLFVISLRLSDPEKSAHLLNRLIYSLNEYLKKDELRKLNKEINSYQERISVTKSQEELSMLYSLLERAIGKKTYVEADDEYVFRTIDPAQIPRSPWWPNYLIISALIIFAWLTLSTLYLFIKSRK